MCTVTLLSIDGTRRLVCNRDEQLNRPPAEPPHLHVQNNIAALYPRDPQGGGTWVGGNQHGMLATLLNGNPTYPHQPAVARTRGEIVPHVLAATTYAEVQRLIDQLDWTVYPACRLLVSCTEGARSWGWDGRSVQLTTHTDEQAVFFTSSGLGDHVVESRRRALWDEWFTPGEHPFSRQDMFHRHRWPDQRELSINMDRFDARTVSCTTVSVDSMAVTMHYHAGAPDGPGIDSVEILALS